MKFYIQELSQKNVIIIYDHTIQRKLLLILPLLPHCVCVITVPITLYIVFEYIYLIYSQAFSHTIKPC